MRSGDGLPSKIAGIEAARGIAAILVVFYHAARHIAQYSGELPFGNASVFGHAGVDFFFVLSGFIIVFVHERDIGRPDRIGRYVQRRFTRIFPLYWVALAAKAAVLTLSPTRDLPGAGVLLLNASLLPLKAPILGVAWTLQLEMLFYAVFLILIANRAAGMGLLMLWGALTTSSLFGARDGGAEVVNALSSPYCLQFFMGMAAAWLVRRAALPAPRLVLGVGITAFAVAGLLENLGVMDGYDAWPARIVYGLSATVALLGIVGCERQGGLAVPRALVSLGDASYAIYLFHLIAIGAVSQVLRWLGLRESVPAELQYLLLAAAGVVGGIVISRVVEKPVLGLSRRLFSTPGDGLLLPTPGR